MTADTPSVPEHITPRALYDMTSAQLDDMLEGIRQRRLNAVRMHEQAVAEAKAAADDRARMQLFKQAEMLENNIIRVDKALEAMEARINKMRALRLELGLD